MHEKFSYETVEVFNKMKTLKLAKLTLKGDATIKILTISLPEKNMKPNQNQCQLSHLGHSKSNK